MPLLLTPFTLLYGDIKTVYLVLNIEFAVVNNSILHIDCSLCASCLEIAVISLEIAVYL